MSHSPNVTAPVTDPILRDWALDEVLLASWRIRLQEAPDGPSWAPVTARRVPDSPTVTDTRDRLSMRWGV